MKYISILIFMFFSQIAFSQSYDYIKKLDTIYIKFKKGRYTVKIDYPEEKNGFKNRSYLFNYKKKKENTFNFELDRNKASENKKINKSFIKKYKKKIITINALKNLEYQDVACNAFNRLKIIYIIDYTEKKEMNIMLYRVMSMNICYSKE